jgi:hypothetical protein
MNTTLDRKVPRDLCIVLCGCFVTSLVSAADDDHPAAPATKSTQLVSAIRPVAPAGAVAVTKPQFQYRLSAHDLDAIIVKHHAIAAVNDSTLLEAVEVTSPTELVPMHTPEREIWGGLAAPFWAIAHPTQAWRILVPMPPE